MLVGSKPVIIVCWIDYQSRRDCTCPVCRYSNKVWSIHPKIRVGADYHAGPPTCSNAVDAPVKCIIYYLSWVRYRLVNVGVHDIAVWPVTHLLLIHRRLAIYQEARV